MKKLHVVIIILMVFLSGCTDNEATPQVQTSNYVGLVTSVYAESLPSSLFEGDEVFLQLTVENKGDYDVPTANYHLNVKGINPAAFERLDVSDLTHDSSDVLLSLGSFGNETIVRGQEVFTIGNSFYYCNDIENDFSLNLHAKSCYDYRTTSEVSGCFIRSTTSTGDEVCVVSEFKPVTNSAAPVAITEVAESVAGSSKVRFRVKVENLGAGAVFDKYGVDNDDVTNTIQACDSLPRGSGWNVIYIEDITLDGSSIASDAGTFKYEGGVENTASGRSRFRLDKSGVGRFSFTTEVTSVDFVGKVGIELGYGYSETDIFSTKIKALSNFAPMACTDPDGTTPPDSDQVADEDGVDEDGADGESALFGCNECDGDEDNDGVPDDDDDCPYTDATNNDDDGDGCIDPE